MSRLSRWWTRLCTRFWMFRVALSQQHIMIAIDQSGSVPDEVAKYYRKLGKFCSRFCKVTLIVFDSEIRERIENYKGEELRLMSWGGTLLGEVVREYHDSDCTYCFVFTDGWLDAPKVQGDKPITLVVSEESALAHLEFNRNHLDVRSLPLVME